MEIFLIFALGAIGLTHIIVDGSICQWFRDLVDKIFPKWIAKMVHCYQCMGFWVGLFCGVVCFYPLFYIYGWVGWLLVLIGGGASSFLSNLAAAYLNYLDARAIIRLPDDEE